METANKPPPAPPNLKKDLTIALAGNPNVGKTTLFNALTGLSQKVANYPGVTVEKKSGRCALSDHASCDIIDLPGTYSLASRSPDEHVARQVVLGQIPGTPRPDIIVVVTDASNLERNLYLVTQVLEIGRPAIVALTMCDIAQDHGKTIDIDKLSRHLRAPVVPIAPHLSTDNGIPQLKAAIAHAGRHLPTSDIQALDLPLPDILETHIDRLKKILAAEKLSLPDQTYFDAHLMLTTADDEADGESDPRRHHPKVRQEITAALQACAAADIDPLSVEVEAHYTFIGTVVADCLREQPVSHKISRTDRIDRVVTHRHYGMAIFLGIMALMFWSIFFLAAPIMKFLSDDVFGKLATYLNHAMPPGPLASLLTEGIIPGVGNVVVFIPQITLLFLFISILEDSGYMSRAAFLMDRHMARVGLHGKSFIPLLSGYACAVPAIMGTRVIENRRDRLATILILPLMSCSARLPIYTLLISLFFGTSAFTAAAVMLSMYLLGTLSALALARIFKSTLLKGPAPAFIIEMPPYHLPHARVVASTVANRSWDFLKSAGTIIFAFSVVMWAATHYPKPAHYTNDYDGQILRIEQDLAGTDRRTTPENLELEKNLNHRVDLLKNLKSTEILESSAAGRFGKTIAPIFYPLGFDWKTSVGITGAFAAREVIVSTLGICYSVGDTKNSTSALQAAMKSDTWPPGTPRAGKPIWTPLTAITLMVFAVFCMQCLSTLTVVQRETRHWKWPLFMFAYMTTLAYLASLLTFQVGSLLVK